MRACVRACVCVCVCVCVGVCARARARAHVGVCRCFVVVYFSVQYAAVFRFALSPIHAMYATGQDCCVNNNNNKEDFWSAHPPQKVGAQGALK